MSSVIVEVVLHRHVEEESYVAVGYPVEDLAALLASPDQTGKTKLTELMAGSRFGGFRQQS
jgi:hypothetical protein